MVPRYQRSYVWKEPNWKELNSDIEFTINNKSDLEWSHFLGTIVLNELLSKKRKKIVSGIETFEIVDGQQRLTTVYVMFACLCYLFKKIGSEDSKKRANYIKDTLIYSTDSDYTQVMKIENEDLNEDFKELIQNLVEDNEFLNKENKFYDCANFFRVKLKDYNLEKLDIFLSKLQNIKLIEIVSNQEEEIYNIFEVLNARGQKLKQMELLKNHIMKYIQPRNNEIVDKTKKKWNVIIENSKHLSDVDNLITHFWKCYIRKNA